MAVTQKKKKILSTSDLEHPAKHGPNHRATHQGPASELPAKTSPKRLTLVPSGKSAIDSLFNGEILTNKAAPKKGKNKQKTIERLPEDLQELADVFVAG